MGISADSISSLLMHYAVTPRTRSENTDRTAQCRKLTYPTSSVPWYCGCHKGLTSHSPPVIKCNYVGFSGQFSVYKQTTQLEGSQPHHLHEYEWYKISEYGPRRINLIEKSPTGAWFSITPQSTPGGDEKKFRQPTREPRVYI